MRIYSICLASVSLLMKKLTALFVISFQQVLFGAPEPDRTPRSISEALFSRSAAFLAFLDLHSWRKRSMHMHTVTLHLKQNGGGQSAGIL